MPISVPGDTRSAPSTPYALDECVHMYVCVWERETVFSMPALNEMDQSVMALLLLIFNPTWTLQHKFLVKDSMDAVKSYLLYS